MIENIVFDMGQVLIHWQPERLIAHLGLSPQEKETVLRELFQSVEWIRLDRGTITQEEAAERVCARVPAKLHAAVREEIFHWHERPLEGMEGMADLVRELKEAGYGIYLLSNASLALRSYFPRIPGSECFDGLMVSAEEKLLKPQHEIFEAFLARFSLKPETCFFIDDAPANVEGAGVVGIRGAVFRGDTSRLRQELRTAGIRCLAVCG